MSDALQALRTRLDAWRDSGDDRFYPARFHAMDALARRADACNGELRRVLCARLYTLVDAYASDLKQAAHATRVSTPEASTRPLRDLLDHMAQQASASAGDDPDDASATFPQLPALDEFRQRWSALRSESHLRQSQVQAPTNAGPLNSGALVHRAISTMRELSPGYLQHFLSYVDNLAWLEQFSPRVALPMKEAAEPAAAPRKRSRARTKTPRD